MRHLDEWAAKQAIAEQMVPLIGLLHRDRNVVTSLYGRTLVNQSAIDLIKAHRFGRHIEETELPVADTAVALRTLVDLDVRGASIDLAALLAGYRAQRHVDPELSLPDHLRRALVSAGEESAAPERGPRDVVLYGFGRIGRLVARILVSHAGRGAGLQLRAIVVRRNGPGDLRKRAGLLRRDSIHGPFDGTITVDEERETILANGNLIQVIYSDDPGAIDYTRYGIDDAILVDSTGRWRDEAGLSQHLSCPGVGRVLLTAPGKGALKNIVHGVNHTEIADDDRILSAASCTTNAVTPVLKAVHDEFQVVRGHIETIHSFTNDQNLIDNYHKADRRGRAAGLNMVLTETGAARAVAKALPQLAGRLTGNAIRVPTPDVSIAVLNLQLSRPTTVDELNGMLRATALTSPLQRQVGFVESPDVVSTDFVGARQTGIVDGLATIAEGENVVIYVWYDNEYGYTHQVVRVLEEMAAVHPPVFPRSAAATVARQRRGRAHRPSANPIEVVSV
ncbi:glyceraldehyde-3-phosphate dehydrogenase [Lysobacter korlensis]|uniref:Glyceraldehyde-3-phosphate dehydrogenase n=1 Tax=Lysobacter korlensis TaxID=553636 RepID=A0ABV6RUE9_9GAMM